MFKQVKSGRGGSRSGILKTRAGLVKTPFFMPCASRGAVKGLTPAEVAAIGTKVMLANAYHLHIQPGEKVVKKLGGLHKFSGWNGPILTDSGGFQVFSLAKIRKITEEGVVFKRLDNGQEVLITPEKSIQIQLDLGSDISMAFDDVTGLSMPERSRSKEAVERTHRWLVRCITEFNHLTKTANATRFNLVAKRPLLFGIVQGGLDKKLRAQSLEFVQSQAVDGIAIGGLAVGETRPEMYKMLKFLAPLYDKTKVRYLMGVGEPVDMRYGIEHGIDMFDCVLPTRNGRHGQVWITAPRLRSGSESDKKLNLNHLKFAKDPRVIDPGGIESDQSDSSAKGGIPRGRCDCSTCQTGYSRAFLRHLFKVGDPLAGRLASIHNLRYLARLCESYR